MRYRPCGVAVVCLAVLLCLGVRMSWAQPIVAVGPASRSSGSPAAVQTTVVTVAVSRAAAPEEALKYSLLPDAADIVPGNAAVFYLRAMTTRQSPDAPKDDEALDGYIQGPVDGPARDEARRIVAKYRSTMHQLELAARQQTCDWQLPLRQEGITLLLPELSHMRELARLLAAQARIQIADRQYDQAIRTLQMGFAMCRHLNEQALLIHGLVAVSNASLMLGCVRELSQRPDAPNLYWALASLPRPFIDPRTAMTSERNILYYTFPQLKDATRRPMSTAEWQKIWDDLRQIGNWAGQSNDASMKMLLAASMVRDYGRAKSYVASTGVPADQIEKMPASQVVAMYFVHQYELASGDMWKWWLVPFPQAQAGCARSEAALLKLVSENPANPFFALVPAVGRARVAFVRLDREIAAMQCVEALRAYAAAHNGGIPASLDELVDMPVPADPTTGKPLLYTVHGPSATLESPMPVAGGTARDALRYEITIK